MSVQKALDHFKSNYQTYLNQLIELSKIDSVSFDGFDLSKVEESAHYTADLLKSIGMDNVELLYVKDTHPNVFAEKIIDPALPTVLLYAHHDVQPPMREEKWNTRPFEPTLVGKRLFGRGTADDKAGILIHVASIDSILKTSNLPVNVKVIIEGEEEIGSPNLAAFLKKYSDKLQADCMVLTDLTNYDTGVPSLTTTLRGMVILDVEVGVMDHPLHSGMWGGPIPDPITGLSKIIAGLTDENGKITIPELYRDVRAPTANELDSYKNLGMNKELLKQQIEVHDSCTIFGDNEELLLKMWREPSLVVNSIESGGRKNAGNVIMDSAWARIGIRIVPDMKWEHITELLENKIKELCPWGLKLTMERDTGVDPWITDTDHPVFELARKSLEKGYNKEAVYIGCGGSIPFVDPMSSLLGNIPALLVGVEDPYTNAHGENESLHLGDFQKAIMSQIHFFFDLAESGLFK